MATIYRFDDEVFYSEDALNEYIYEYAEDDDRYDEWLDYEYSDYDVAWATFDASVVIKALTEYDGGDLYEELREEYRNHLRDDEVEEEEGEIRYKYSGVLYKTEDEARDACCEYVEEHHDEYVDDRTGETVIHAHGCLVTLRASWVLKTSDPDAYEHSKQNMLMCECARIEQVVVDEDELEGGEDEDYTFDADMGGGDYE